MDFSNEILRRMVFEYHSNSSGTEIGHIVVFVDVLDDSRVERMVGVAELTSVAQASEATTRPMISWKSSAERSKRPMVDLY
jgi:hypothetical protein